MSNADIGSAQRFFAITPHNSTNFARCARALYVGVGGNISAVGRDGVTVLFTAVPQGSTLIGDFLRINATGTTASALVGYV
jgi:hypothetical protein